jgi:hypothetical protein
MTRLDSKSHPEETYHRVSTLIDHCSMQLHVHGQQISLDILVLLSMS